jgi:MFS family permease
MFSGLSSLAVTLAIQALVSMAAMSAPVLAPSAAQSFRVEATYVGVFVGLIYLGATWATLASGAFIRRYGAIRVSQVALLCCAAGLGASLSGYSWALIPCALVIGFGYGPVTPASSHVLVRTVPQHLMSFVFSLKQTGVPLGGALAGLILPPIIVHFGWRPAVVAVCVACVATALFASPTRAALDVDRKPSYPLSVQAIAEPLRIIWSLKSLRLLCVSSFFFCVVQVSLSTFLTSYLAIERNYALIAAGAVFSVTQASGVIGRIVWGYLSDRFLSPPVMLGLLGIMMLGTCGLAVFGSEKLPDFLLTGVFALYGATATGWNGVFLAEVARLAPAEKTGAATGGALAMTYLGAVIGPPVFALITGYHGSYGMAFVAISLPAGFCGLALLKSRHLFTGNQT